MPFYEFYRFQGFVRENGFGRFFATAHSMKCLTMRVQRWLLVLSIFSTVVFALTTSVAEASITCRSIYREMQQTAAELEVDLLTDSMLLNRAMTLKERAGVVDPLNTHLPEMVLPAQQIIRQIQLAMLEKTSEKLFPKRKPLLDKVIQEIQSRIEEQKLTYEFSAALPIRVGYLLKMNDHDPTRKDLEPDLTYIETSYFYQDRSYATHKAFMMALKKMHEHISPKINGHFVRRPVLETFYFALKSFPNGIIVPAFHDLSIPILNHLMKQGFIPLGNIRKAFFSFTDSIFFDEQNFPIHDLFHGRRKDDLYDGQSISERMASRVETESLNNIESQSNGRRQIWHIFHFFIFHESVRYQYLPDASPQGLSRVYQESLVSKLEMLEEGAKIEIFPDWFMKLSPEEQTQLIEIEREAYLNKIAEIIFRFQAEFEQDFAAIREKSKYN